MTAPKMLLLTHTDRLLTSDGGHPSLIDIAVGISRQPRFGGQTGRWWSVIDHSLLCDELTKELLEEGDVDARRLCRLALLLHDAHEGLSGDVPSPLKTPDFKRMQDALDERIYGAYFPGGYAGFLDCVGTGLVKNIDLRALRVEASIFLPHAAERITPIFGETEADDIVTLARYLDKPYAALPPLARDQSEHPAVREYLNRLLTLM